MTEAKTRTKTGTATAHGKPDARAPTSAATESAARNAIKRRLKRIAHHLDPIVLVGDQGVSDAVIAETRRALEDHELIKVRIHGADRVGRQALAVKLAEACEADIIQSIGKVTVLFRKNPHPDLRLSNLARFGSQ
jgi:RNA-binding protein